MHTEQKKEATSSKTQQSERSSPSDSSPLQKQKRNVHSCWICQEEFHSDVDLRVHYDEHMMVASESEQQVE